MNPLADRRGKVVDPGLSPSDIPMQLPPLAEEASGTARGEDADARHRGELFLPGWLRIEREPTAEQGPGAA